MAKHFIIWEDGVEDNIEVFNSEPVIVVHAAREDLDKLSSLDEANLPGVYVLYAGNTRYVGQASKSVYNRISQHDKRKPWWTNLVIIAREDGRLDKSQLDFMENRLIKDSMRADLTMDNGNTGNSSHIETYQRGKTQQVLVTGLRILKENAGVKLFKKENEHISSVEGTEKPSTLRRAGTSILDNRATLYGPTVALPYYRVSYTNPVTEKRCVTTVGSDHDEAVLRAAVIVERSTSN